MNDKLDELAEMLEPANGNARWDALQDWMKANPKYRREVDHCLELTPREALNYLGSRFGLPVSAIRIIAPNHPQIIKAEKAIETIQQLYRERKELDEPKPKKLKAKKKKKEKAK